jgi:hypothetical protein
MGDYDYDWNVQVDSSGWVDADYLSISLTDTLGWSDAMSCKFSLDNNLGNMRKLCLPERQIRAVRNGTQHYLGIVNNATAKVTAQAYSLEVDSRSYYADKLLNKQTGDSYLWNFSRLNADDLYRAFIGTMFIVQEQYVNQWRVDAAQQSNITFIDQKAQLTPNGAAFQATGYYVSKTLQNTEDWDTMGNINSVAVTITTTLPAGSSVAIQVSRDDGATFNDVTLTWDGVSQYTGTYTFAGAEATKNKLKYKLTLNAGTGNTSTPQVSQVLLRAATESDTGIVEGAIETWAAPAALMLPDNTITQDFSGLSRFQAIENLMKITGQEGTIDGTGHLYIYNKRCGVNWPEQAGDYHFDDASKWSLSGGASILSSELKLQSADGVAVSMAQCTVSGIPASDTLCFAVRAKYADGTGVAGTLYVDLQADGYDNGEQELQVTNASLTADYQVFHKNNFSTGTPPANVNVRLFTYSTRPILVDWIVVAKRPVHIWDTDTMLTSLTYQRIREAMANAVIVIGSGNITDEVKLYGKYTLQDAGSIFKYGRIEKRIQEKNIADLGALGARAWVILQQLKEPADKLTGSILDPTDSTWQIGDRVCVIDKTGTSGVDTDRIFRISKITRTFNANGGETVNVEFANVSTELESALNAVVDHINNYLNTDQANNVPTPATAWTECDAATPAECLVWIDPTKTVQKIILNVFSRKFRANNQASVAGTAMSSNSGGGNTTNSVGDHTHPFSTPAHAHTNYITTTTVAQSCGTANSSHSHTTPAHQHHVSFIMGPGNTDTDGSSSGMSSGGSHAHTLYGTNISYVTLTTSELISDAGSTAYGGGSHNHAINSHSHSIPSHSHGITFGIYEFGYYAPVTMHINSTAQAANPFFGTQGSEAAPFTCSGLDITSWYNAAGGAGLLGPGQNFIYFKSYATTNNPLGLLRLYTQIQVIYK